MKSAFGVDHDEVAKALIGTHKLLMVPKVEGMMGGRYLNVHPGPGGAKMSRAGWGSYDSSEVTRILGERNKMRQGNPPLKGRWSIGRAPTRQINRYLAQEPKQELRSSYAPSRAGSPGDWLYTQGVGRKTVNTYRTGTRWAPGQVRKSMVAPGVYRPASMLDRVDRSVLRSNIGAPGRRLKPLNPNNNFSLAISRAWRESGIPSTTLGRKINFEHRNESVPLKSAPHEEASASAAPNGRGGGRIRFFHGSDAQPHVVAHEMAHLAPKRNAFRYAERINDPFRRGREEGRADFTAFGRRTPGRYPGNKAFQAGYEDVQSRMAYARGNKQSSGTKVPVVRGSVKPRTISTITNTRSS